MTISEKEALISELKVMRKVMEEDGRLLSGTCDSMAKIDIMYDDINEETDGALCDIYADLVEATVHISDATRNLNDLLKYLEG